jgi:hypothetical protein
MFATTRFYFSLVSLLDTLREAILCYLPKSLFLVFSLITEYLLEFLLWFVIFYSAIVRDVEESPIHVDAVIDPLSATGQKLSPLLVLLQEWIKPSMRICFNPMASTCISCVPNLLLSAFM